jgi:hypothetical protein
VHGGARQGRSSSAISNEDRPHIHTYVYCICVVLASRCLLFVGGALLFCINVGEREREEEEEEEEEYFNQKS